MPKKDRKRKKKSDFRIGCKKLPMELTRPFVVWVLVENTRTRNSPPEITLGHISAERNEERNLNSLVFIGYTTGSKTHVKSIMIEMIEGLYLKCGCRPLTHWITEVFVA